MVEAHDHRHASEPDIAAASRLLGVVRELAAELRAKRAGEPRVGLDSDLDADLGLDSLGRSELLLRLQREFEVELPPALLAEAESPRDLLAAVLNAAAAESGGEARPVVTLPPLEPEAETPVDATTLVEMLDWHADKHPERPHILLPDDGRSISYAELAETARAAAHGLRAWGLEPGERVAIMLPTGADFFVAFYGIVYAGGVPVPIYPPARPAQLEDHLRRQAAILVNAGAVMLITIPEARPVALLLRAQVASLRSVESVADLRHQGEAGALPPLQATAMAFLQYTSGSTGDPKGVVLSHANLLANIRAMGQVLEANATDIFISWLPLYYDMGLIGAWLGALYYAIPTVIMSPLTFLARPASWLWAIHEHRGTLSAAPNFAFELCLKRTTDEELKGLDLSSLRMVANGAEPVSPNTIRDFAARFEPYGFRPEALSPVYGLAESSVGIAFPPVGRGPLIDRIDRRALADRGEAIPATDGETVEIVACGQPLPGHQMRVIDDTGRELPARREGRLQFQGPSSTDRYFNNPEKTAALFDGAWLETGDLAYIAGGDIFLTGRIKDIIIRAGRNVHPHEVEEAVGNVEGIRRGCVAVFGVADPASGTDRIVVLAETRETDSGTLAQLRRRTGEVAADFLGLPADDVVLAPPHSVLKTSSGKIRRAASRDLYVSGRIGKGAPALWRQFLRLTIASIAPQLRRGLRTGLQYLYAAYWWTVLVAVAVAVWPLVVMLPRRRWRWRTLGAASRLFLRATATALEVQGHADAGFTGVVVANHSSYLDSLVLAAALPGEFAFVAKKELAGQVVAGLLLRRLGALFVERFEAEESVEDAAATGAAVARGERVVFYPEGTLTRAPGLMPFRLGAFVAAAQGNAPVLPVTIRGTRSVLRGAQWFPRKGRISVRIAEPVAPQGADWAAAIELRNAVRQVMLDACGEPDLAT